MIKPVTVYLSENGMTYSTPKEAEDANLCYREYEKGPIPVDVLKRRSGKPKRCREYIGSFYGPCYPDPGKTCLAGSQKVYELEYHGRARTYWVYRDNHAGGERPLYDRWRVYDDKRNLPIRARIDGCDGMTWRNIKL